MECFNGKCAVVTGGATGLGLHYVKELLKQGISKCAILDVNTKMGEESCKLLSAEFGKDSVIFIKCDVTNMSEFDEAVKEVVAKFKQLDILINNAGYCDEMKWERMLDINLRGVIQGSILGMRYMGKDQGGRGGTIVNIASIVGLDPAGCAPVYCATKGGIIAYSRAMATPYHFNRTGIRFLIMCPGVTMSEMVKGIMTMYPTEEQNKQTSMEFSLLPIQGPEDVAKNMMTLLHMGKNGSVWVSEGGEPIYEVGLKQRNDLKQIMD